METVSKQPLVSIASLIYKSKVYADWVYDSIMEFTHLVPKGEAEFFFVANDATDDLLHHLKRQNYPHYVNHNAKLTEEELFALGYAEPEYIHRVYQGWNKAIEYARGDTVVLVNSDNYFSPDWLENLLKHVSSSRIVCSKLVERWHPKHGVFPSAYHMEFGTHPNNFRKDEFLMYCRMLSRNEIEPGGSYMPCAFLKSLAIKAGLYPEGNIAGSSFHDVFVYGDEAFFNTLFLLGAEHITALDSLVYHVKEGEMDEYSDIEHCPI